jgi:acyl-CoA synthetase (AMP-forming)/AMP-acid ligase II
LDRGADRIALRYVVFGGERLSMAVLRPWVERRGLDEPALVNMYGLTEATVHTTYHRVTADDLAGDESVIGRPLPGFVARVVDDSDRGSLRGELLVAGPQVAAGYLNRPELTADRFRADPTGESDRTFYRTGDLVEVRGDDLVYLGRADRQIKVRGHRIELGEIEAAVSAVDDVAEACVVLARHRDGPALVCAYTTHSGRPLRSRALRLAVRNRVPQYMLPASFQWFASMPLTVNGKTDVQILKSEMELTR